MSRPTFKRPGARATARESAGWQLSPGALRGIWMLLGWALLLAILVWGLRRLDERMTTPPPDLTCRLEWVDLPMWLMTPENEWVLNDLKQLADVRPTDNVYDPQLCARVGQSLSSSPWVAQVRRITKRPDGVVRADVVFREPSAYVDVHGRAYLVDQTGVLLPLSCRVERVKLEDWFLITGVSKPVPEQPGEHWPGDDLAAALSLVKFLKEAAVQGRLPFRAALGPIDASARSGGDVLLHIRTHPDCFIDWGLAPGKEYNVDTASANRKIDLLNTAYDKHGQFPDQIVVVRWKEGVQYQPPKRR